METQKQQLSVREVLRIDAFRRLWLGQLISLTGDFLAVFAVLAVATYQFHGTPVQLTLINVSFLLPFAVIGPLAGVFVDGWNPRRAMIGSDLIRAALILLLLVAPGLHAIYVILLSLSVVSTFFVPAQTIMLRTVVPPEGLMSANALMQQAMQLVRVLAPFLAGTLVAVTGARPVYVFDSLSFLFSAAMIAAIALDWRTTAPQQQKQRTVSSTLSELKEGVKFIFTHPSVSFVVLSLTAGMFAISSFGPLVAVYVRDFLQKDETIFGVVNTLIGVGMITGTLFIARFARTRSKKNLVIEGLLGIGLSVALMAMIVSLPVALLGALGIGFGSGFLMVAANTIIQQETPMELAGRVSSSVWALMSMAQLFGLALAGAVAQRFGILLMFYFSAAFLTLIAVFGFFQLSRQPAPGVAES
ncbi:MAG: MFS transporter [Blastocatellia bacterium]